MARQGFSVCIGPDSVLLREYIHSISKENSLNSSWEEYVFWGDDSLSDDFWDKLLLQDLFSKPRIVILRNAQSLSAESLSRLSKSLGSANETIWPVICFEVPFEKSKPKLSVQINKLKFIDFARSKGWVKEIFPLDSRGIKAFVEKEAKRLGLKLKADEISLISDAQVADAGSIKLQMEQLSLAMPEGIFTDGAKSMLDIKSEIDIFTLLKNLQSGEAPNLVWAQVLKNGEGQTDSGLFSFIAMLLREARILWQLAFGENVFLPGFVLQQKKATALALGPVKLSKIWDLALKADKGVKTGEHSPEQAIEKLVSDLFCLFK